MRVLITGGGGFLGSHLGDGLLAAGHEVMALDIAPDLKVRHNLGKAGFRYLKGSVFDTDLLESLVAKADLVYHLAAVVGGHSDLVAALLAWRIPQATIVRRGRFRPDIVGALLFTLSALALLFALSSGGHRFDWRSWPMAALAGGALIGFTLLVIWERHAADPVIPIRFFGVPAIVRSDAVVICFAGALFASILYLPLYLQLGRGLGIGQSGLLLLPITLSMVASSAITGRLVTRTGEVTLFPQLGLALATLAFLLLAVTVTIGSTLTVLSLTLLVGAGLGMVMSPTQVAVQHAAGRESLGSATASISVSRAVGGAIGVAIVGAILFAMLATPDGVTSTAVREVVEGGPAYVDRLSEGERATLTASLDQAYRVIFVVIAGITALGALVARTIPSPNWTQ